MSLLGVLLYCALAIVALVAVALFMPFGIKFEAVKDGTLKWTLNVQPFGRFGPMVRVPKSKTSKPAKTKKPSKSSRRHLRNPRQIAGAGIRLGSDLLAAFHIRNFAIDVRFGCNDPADTGYIFGMITPLLYGTSGFQRVHMHADPVFETEVFEGRAMIDVSIVPIKLLPPIFRFGWQAFGPSR